MHGESCAGSRLEELAVAGGLVASESVQNIIWRNYNKGMQYKVHCMEKLNAMCIKAVIPFHFEWELRCETLVPIMQNI